MKKIIFFIAAFIILLGIPVMVKAGPPGSPGPIWEVLEELTARIDLLDGGEDFEIPDSENWNGVYDLDSKSVLMRPPNDCYWPDLDGARINSNVQTRASATTSAIMSENLLYGSGSCNQIKFDWTPGGLPVTLEAEISFWWMGKEESYDGPIFVSIDSLNPDYCGDPCEEDCEDEEVGYTCVELTCTHLLCPTPAP